MLGLLIGKEIQWKLWTEEHKKGDVNRLYFAKREVGRELLSVENTIPV